MILDDFVMLGTTVPEPSLRTGRVFVCSAGVSTELGSLIRIYPLARLSVPHRWDMFRVPLERNPQDSRRESFKIRADRDPGAHEQINRAFERIGRVTDAKRSKLLAPFVMPSIAWANERRASLGIVHGSDFQLHFRETRGDPDVPEVSWFDPAWAPEQAGAKHFPYSPYLHFRDDDGWHDLPVRDWGAYELMRKHLHDDGYYRTNMASALHLKDSSSLLVGNQVRHRNVWLVISVLNGIRLPDQLTMPELSLIGMEA